MAKITKALFINQIATHKVLEDVTKKDVTTIVNHVLETITANLVAGHSVNLSGLGKFETVILAARVARVPGTNKEVNVPSKRVAKFRPSKNLRTKVAK